MGRLFVVEVEGRSYRCKCCATSLALSDDVISKSFSSNYGRAFLFNNVVNVSFGTVDKRMMMSGMHTVCDVFCCCCGQILGWKYVEAHDRSQKFKEGKFVLERRRITEESIDVNLDAQMNLSDAESA